MILHRPAGEMCLSLPKQGSIWGTRLSRKPSLTKKWEGEQFHSRSKISIDQIHRHKKVLHRSVQSSRVSTNRLLKKLWPQLKSSRRLLYLVLWSMLTPQLLTRKIISPTVRVNGQRNLPGLSPDKTHPCRESDRLGLLLGLMQDNICSIIRSKRMKKAAVSKLKSRFNHILQIRCLQKPLTRWPKRSRKFKWNRQLSSKELPLSSNPNQTTSSLPSKQPTTPLTPWTQTWCGMPCWLLTRKGKSRPMPL